MKHMSYDDLFDHEMTWPPPPAEQAAEADPPSADGPTPDDQEPQAKPDDNPARSLPGGGGVYLLTDEEDRLIQLASAGDLRRALRGRLIDPPADDEQAQTPAARRKARLGEIVRRIRWRSCHSMFEVDWSYHRIARQLIPKDYLENVAFGPAWFLHVDAKATVPRFLVGKHLRPGPGLDLGPFAAQSGVNQFVQSLQDGFDLCRYEHILEQTPDGQPCAYFEMGRCPAPCDGSQPMDAYRRTVAEAVAFAVGPRQAVYDRLTDEMQAAAEDLAFERAGVIKQRRNRLQTVDHVSFRLVRPIESFNYLIVQRGRGRTWVKPFFVRRGFITPGEPVRLKQLDDAVPGWLEAMRQLPPTLPERIDDGDRYRSEFIWLVSHYLFKREPPGLWLHESELPRAEALRQWVLDRFEPKRAEPDTEASHP